MTMIKTMSRHPEPKLAPARVRCDKAHGRGVSAVLAACVLVLATAASATMGLRSKFAEVHVQKLKIGKTYSLAQLVNLPLRVTNTGTEPLDLAVDVVAPRVAGEFKEGYDPIPDTDWIHLERSSFTLTPGMEAATDVLITIPNDPALLGRRFVVYIWTHSENLSYSGIGLKGRLLLSISSLKPTDDELKEKLTRKRTANLNFSLSPMEIVLSDVKVGERVSVKGGEDSSPVVLVSPNPGSLTFRLMPIPVWETLLAAPPGFEMARDARWLEIEKPTIKMKPFSIEPLKLSVLIPAEDRFKGRRYMLLMRAEILEQDMPAYAYVKIFVETAK